LQICDLSGEDEPLVSHIVESDIKVLEKESLITRKVSTFVACRM